MQPVNSLRLYFSRLRSLRLRSLHLSTLAMLKLAMLSIVLASGAATAQQSDLAQPINIDADRAEVDYAANSSIYTGDVRLTQGSILVKADRVELSRTADKRISAVLDGKPSTYSQRLDDGTNVAARANRIVYGREDAVIELSGNAQIIREGDRVAAQTIRYNIREGRTLGTGRVSVTITPPAAKN